MGLMIHSMGEVPANVERSFYIYLLDYGWQEPIRDALFENFHLLADHASKNDAVVFQGTVGHHFTDEVLSWHSVNGIDGKDILPAILITTRNPHEFSERRIDPVEHNMLLVPLKNVCTTATDVIGVIQKIVADIAAKKELPDFTVAQEIKAGESGSLVDALILQPNISGIGVDFNKIISLFRRKKSARY
ncbi:hypothetical protein [Vibrio aestuarianus]|uniref:Uncharacterized protein n=3 Tax=Vibrio aestuarianus TaxID=28171 RepID=A0ABM9FUC5_9VIBR|nr:hypothetical protein [Vibrio aestuarianus]MDE1215497.1 hypothetical protein [Vibrio aestuarianus]MDE1218550.1 hypothetical protein [Vibrio aestuarianus]MDE1258013.1 hypothetical protein [Vibrio aestuarianus]MDE1262600.1 hypothetical protein [Vibrio aestuarianus]MDE1269826.1 hypothetical protein [Vibrio aestuarianus]